MVSDKDFVDSSLLSDCYWICSGSQRKEIFKTFNSEKFPNEIQKELNIPFSNVSRVLKAFTDRGILECLQIENGSRIYKLTDKGNLLRKKMLEAEKENSDL